MVLISFFTFVIVGCSVLISFVWVGLVCYFVVVCLVFLFVVIWICECWVTLAGCSRL